jgi:NAD(P)-dependent dehydrogenase (short-subunit alcohol dehydrogenase family)
LLYDFTGKVGLVTGAASGIGLAVATRLVEEGAAVGLLDVDPSSLDNAAAKLRDLGGTVAAAVADVSSSSAVDAAVAEVERNLGPVDLLVNNAGIVVIKPYVEHTEDDFDRQVAVNLRGAHLLMRRLLPGMVERGSGAVVNISSAAAIRYTVPHAAYAASKAGLIALTRDVGFEVARAGVRVNCVAPGLIAVERSATKTPFLASQTAESGRPLDTRSSTRPLGHGRPEDIADAVAFLLSDQARFIIGVTLPVAGGTDLQVTMAFPGE